MIGFGRYNPFPFQFGGGDSVLEDIHLAVLDALSPAWDVSEGTTAHAEAYVDAVGITFIWMCNRRLSNQMNPMKMLENLATWEESCGLRPAPSDTDVARRRALAAKLRAQASNALVDLEAVCLRILGKNFSMVTQPDPAQWITYWPGVNPGPPGFEWASNRAKICVRIDPIGLTNSELVRKRDQVVEQLDAACPAWMSFCVGVGTDFIPNIGIVGQTIL